MSEPAKTSRRTVVLASLGGAIVGIPLLVFLGWLVSSCREARATSNAFVTAVREGRMADAYAITSPELLARLTKPSADASPAQTLVLLRTAPDSSLGVVQSGFGGTWHWIPFACFDGKLDAEKKYWIVAARQAQQWQVVELRSDRLPKVCEGE